METQSEEVEYLGHDTKKLMYFSCTCGEKQIEYIGLTHSKFLCDKCSEEHSLCFIHQIDGTKFLLYDFMNGTYVYSTIKKFQSLIQKSEDTETLASELKEYAKHNLEARERLYAQHRDKAKYNVVFKHQLESIFNNLNSLNWRLTKATKNLSSELAHEIYKSSEGILEEFGSTFEEIVKTQNILSPKISKVKKLSASFALKKSVLSNLYQSLSELKILGEQDDQQYKFSRPAFTFAELGSLSSAYNCSSFTTTHGVVKLFLTSLSEKILHSLSQKAIGQIEHLYLYTRKEVQDTFVKGLNNISLTEVTTLELEISAFYISKFLNSLENWITKTVESVKITYALMNTNEDLPQLIKMGRNAKHLELRLCAITGFDTIECPSIPDCQLETITFIDSQFWLQCPHKFLFEKSSLPESLKRVEFIYNSQLRDVIELE